MQTTKISLVLSVFTLVFVVGSEGISVDEDLTVTTKEGRILRKLSEKIKGRIEEEFMKEDIFLLRYLRATNFNINAAERRILDTIRWRKENDIQNIANEDWSYFEEEFGYSLDTLSKSGQPILTQDSTRWDVRKAVLAGKQQKLIRWMTKMMEDATVKVRQLQAEGYNVTRWSLLYNLQYFNPVQSSCLQCIPIYINFVMNYERHYPKMADKIILVNTPTIFEVVMNAIRPLMTEETRRQLTVYGTNKRNWQKELLKEIDESQLPVEYGGKKIRDIDSL